MCLMLLSYNLSMAQTKAYSFYLIDAQSGKPIPYLNIISKEDKTAYQSDEKGWIEINNSDPKKTYTSHHLSYESQEFSLNAIKDTLLFEFKAYQLPGIELSKITAEKIVEKAVTNIGNNYSRYTFYLDGTYTQIHKENQKYVRYIEAKTSVQKMGYDKNIQVPQEEKFAVKALRKSYNYEMNGEQHGDHLVDLFLENPLQYLEKSVLNKRNFKLYAWQIVNQNETSYTLSFQNKPWQSARNLTGEIVVNKSDWAILSMTIVELPNDFAREDNESNWRFVNGWYEISFQLQGDKYYVQSSNKWYHHLVRTSSASVDYQYEVEEQFNWETLGVGVKDKSISYSKLTNLYSQYFPYVPLQWEQNKFLEQVRVDLEHKYSLEHQFKNP